MHQSLVDALMQNIDYSNRSHQVDKEIMIEAKYTMFWKNKEARKMDGHPNSLSGSLIYYNNMTFNNAYKIIYTALHERQH